MREIKLTQTVWSLDCEFEISVSEGQAWDQPSQPYKPSVRVSPTVRFRGFTEWNRATAWLSINLASLCNPWGIDENSGFQEGLCLKVLFCFFVSIFE